LKARPRRYARRHLRDFLVRHLADLSSELRGLRQEHAGDRARGLNPPQLSAKSQPAELDEMAQYVDWLMDQDRKTAPLKSLQGKIWKAGYESGELTSQVFQDVPPALKRWRKQGIKLAIFSSGSVLAQKLLFAHTNAGDLTSYLDAHFDTTIGTKIDPLSYRKIARELRCPTEKLVFVSDMVSELEAARAASLRTFLCLRPGNRPQPESGKQASIRGFAELRF